MHIEQILYFYIIYYFLIMYDFCLQVGWRHWAILSSIHGLLDFLSSGITSSLAQGTEVGKQDITSDCYLQNKYLKYCDIFMIPGTHAFYRWRNKNFRNNSSHKQFHCHYKV